MVHEVLRQALVVMESNPLVWVAPSWVFLLVPVDPVDIVPLDEDFVPSSSRAFPIGQVFSRLLGNRDYVHDEAPW